MHELTQLAYRFPSPWLLPAIALVVWACLAVWTLAVMRIRRGMTVVPYQPRCRVPWRAIDVLLVFVLYFAAPLGLATLSMGWFDLGGIEASSIGRDAKLDAEHPVGRLLLESRNGWTLALCVLTAIVVAPIVEEFLFRILLQGWLEAVENRWLRRIPGFRAAVPGTVPVVMASLLFAVVHYRVPLPPLDLRMIVFFLVVKTLTDLLTLGFAVALLRFRTGATLEDLGLVPGKLLADVKLGLLAFLAVIVPVYAIHIFVKALLPANIVGDPIPMFFLAFGLGTLCYRTHRILPAIVMHVAFNATGVAIALTMGGN